MTLGQLLQQLLPLLAHPVRSVLTCDHCCMYQLGYCFSLKFQNSAHMLQAAQKGVTVAAARYSAVRGALGMLGPAMWALLGIDLALKAIGTDYGRIVRAVFALAQIRLLRTHGFSSPPVGT